MFAGRRDSLARQKVIHHHQSTEGIREKKGGSRKLEKQNTKKSKTSCVITQLCFKSSIKHLDHRQISTYNAKNHSDVSSHAIWRLHASQGDSSSHPETAVDEIQEWSVKLLSSTVEPKRYTAAAAVI
jgi:hypothetical protein